MSCRAIALYTALASVLQLLLAAALLLLLTQHLAPLLLLLLLLLVPGRPFQRTVLVSHSALMAATARAQASQIVLSIAAGCSALEDTSSCTSEPSDAPPLTHAPAAPDIPAAPSCVRA
jgi:hypothetical protein